MTSTERTAPGSLPPDVVIRAMTSADLPTVFDIEINSYSMPWGDETFRGLLRRRDAEALVAEQHGAVIGYAIYWWVADQAELGNVAVTATARGQGVGAALVNAVLARAGRRGVREVFLEVRPSNRVAQRLYERLGFVPVGVRRNYYARPTEDALVMRRVLEE
ncbi:MAG: ribosomal protein S18-alanine N-acetyltransferase [Candidatus Cloacimonetes bacterium]|nr:ribosomal protein S18-alanine N-acetyltransferase [Candidatus Cloacimonadota bacterium]